MRCLLNLSLAAMLVASGLPTYAQSTAPAADTPDMAKAKPLAAWEVEELFADKTWVWNVGAAYFKRSPREFTAYAQVGNTVSLGSGRWKVNDGGLMCWDAAWESSQLDVEGGNEDQGLQQTQDGDPPNCFAHVRLDGTIYQKGEPNGRWNVLVGPDGKSTLFSGDQVSEKYRELTASIAAKK